MVPVAIVKLIAIVFGCMAITNSSHLSGLLVPQQFPFRVTEGLDQNILGQEVRSTTKDGTESSK